MFEPLTVSKGPTMFQELYAVARHTPMTIMVTPQGDRLSVIVTPKPSGDAEDNPGLSKPIQAVGTPEELDRDLPAALRQYAEKVNEVRTAINLPIEALEAAQKKGAAKKAAASTTRAENKAAKKKARDEAAQKKKDARTAKSAAKKSSKESAAKKRADAAAARKAKKGAARINLPGTSAPKASKAKRPAVADKAQNHLASKPGKTECIEDFKKMYAKHGDKLTRRLFVDNAPTKRRYEKLWENDWDKFVKAAKRAIGAGDQATDAADPDADPVRGKATDGHNHVFDKKGVYLSSITTKPELGEHIGLVSQDKLLRVVTKDVRPDKGIDYTVVPDPVETAARAMATVESVRAQSSARSAGAPTVKMWTVKNLDGKTLGGTSHEPRAGAILQLALHGAFKVLDVEGSEAVVKRVGDFDASANPIVYAE